MAEFHIILDKLRERGGRALKVIAIARDVNNIVNVVTGVLTAIDGGISSMVNQVIQEICGWIFNSINGCIKTTVIKTVCAMYWILKHKNTPVGFGGAVRAFMQNKDPISGNKAHACSECHNYGHNSRTCPGVDFFDFIGELVDEIIG